MIHFTTRIASLVLAFGFFISCSILQPSTSKTQSQASDDLSEQQIRQKIDSLDQQIMQGDPTASVWYQKGTLLTRLAQKHKDPTQRTSFYSDAHQALTQAAELYTTSSEIDNVQEQLTVTWSNEHNQGVQIFQSDTSAGSPDYARAAAHFRNATVIIPDSATSYTMGARAYYKNEQPENAVSILKEARKNVRNIPPLLLEQLAFLYLENDQPQKAVEIYEQAESFSDRNLNLIRGLSNAYISAEKHQQAVELLEQLVDNEPANVAYRQSLATELYFVAKEKLEVIITELQEGKKIKNTAFDSADSLLNRAEGQFKRTVNNSSEDQDLKLTFAKFYQNSASKYQQMLPYIDNENKKRLENKIQKYLSSSIPLFEQLAEEHPEKQGIWHNLYQAYSYLGMEEKARNAKSNL